MTNGLRLVGLGLVLGCRAPMSPPLPVVNQGLVEPRPADGSTYVGETVHGLYHGKGRLSWPSGTQYVGNFERGLRSGQGKTTRRSGEVHEGLYAFGERHGAGTLLTASGDRFEGEFRNGEVEGRGSWKFASGSTYEGGVLDGELEGKGVYMFADGTTYEGDFRRGTFDGQGEYRQADGATYIGGMKDGHFDGQGRFLTDETVYDGAFEKGDFHGAGRWTDGADTFEGNFERGDLTGHGTHRDADGNLYTGAFAAWVYQGDGVLAYADGRRYEGSFVAGQIEGDGALTLPDGAAYVGAFEGGRYHGKGRYTYSGGKSYSGSFVKGRFHGPGELRWEADGEHHVATGTWEKGKYVDGDTPELLSPTKLDAELILSNQPELLRKSLERIAPSRPGVADLYFLGFGAWGAQDVFMHEVRFAKSLFADRFGAGAHSLALINNRETLDSQPLATVTNLRAALRGLAQRMDPDEDILFLFLSSHGSADHELGISLGKLPLHQLEPTELEQMLDEAGIHWKVVVVSSCHSGGFVAPLADEETLVMTASRADRKSFGCSNEAEFTYFGGAFLRDALPGAESFVEAFQHARNLVTERETEMKFEHSDPQIASAPQIEARLSRWRASLELLNSAQEASHPAAAPTSP